MTEPQTKSEHLISNNPLPKITMCGKNHPQLGMCVACAREQKDEAIKQSRLSLIQELEEWVNSKLMLHTHDSIPSYDADWIGGCKMCLENRQYLIMLSHLKQIKEGYGE